MWRSLDLKVFEYKYHICYSDLIIEKQFLPPIRVKSPAVKDSNISRMMLTESEDNDKESVTCTVEENDLNCHDDDILDLRLEDEFTEDNERLVDYFCILSFSLILESILSATLR